MRIFFALLLALPAATASSSTRIAGCYELELGPWQPPVINDGSDPTDFLPPRVVQLTRRRGKTGTFEANGFTVLAAGGALKSVHIASWWKLEKDGSVGMTWTTGFGGLSMLLRQTAAGFEGEARTFTDYHRPVQTTHVLAKKTRCDSRR